GERELYFANIYPDSEGTAICLLAGASNRIPELLYMGGDFDCHSPTWDPGAGSQGRAGELTALVAVLGFKYLGVENPGSTYISRTPGNRDSVLDLVFVPSAEVLCTPCQRRLELRGPSDHIPRGSDEEADFFVGVGLALELLGGAPLGTIEQLDAVVFTFGNQISNLWGELSKVSKLEGDLPQFGMGSAGSCFSPYSRDHSWLRSSLTTRALSSRAYTGGGDDQYERQTQELELNMGTGDGDMEADEAAIGGALDSIGRKAKALSTNCLGEAGDKDETVRLTDIRPIQALTTGSSTAHGAGGPTSISRDGNTIMADTPAPAAALQPPNSGG
ncbi:hypothetical protein PQX77_020612, partial [Marasmius sp. AFHP31]